MKIQFGFTMLLAASLFLIIATSWPKQDSLITTSQLPSFNQQIVLAHYKISSKRILDPVIMITNFIESSNTPGTYRVRSTATGFGIRYHKKTKTSYVLTNSHVCRHKLENPKILITGITSQREQAHANPSKYQPEMEFGIIKTDKSKDLCLLATNTYIPSVTFAKSTKKLHQFDNLIIVGAPSGNFPIMREARFSGFLERDSVFPNMISGSDNPYLFISEIIHGGHSGSPVFNEKGEVVGIIFGTKIIPSLPLSLSAYGAIATSVEDIYEFLKS